MLTPLLYPSDLPSPWPTGEDVGNATATPYRIWIPKSPLLVLGYSQTPETELHLDAISTDNLGVYKRRGGGGTVYLDAGCVCVAWRISKRDDLGIHDYFGAGNFAVARALGNAFGIEASPRGISDLAVETPRGFRKILGSSLHLPREHALYLASILVDTPVEKLDRYLRHPTREPDYRGGRSHGDFVANLATLSPGITPEKVREAVEKEIVEGSK
jgi:lipoate-protein ligase A